MAVTTALTDSTFRSGSTGTTSSVTSINFGTAFAGRVITIAFVMNGGGKPLSATIGGIAASVAGDWVNVGVGWASAVVPTGTSGTLAITTAATDQAFTYCAIAVTGARDANPVDAILSTTGSGTIDVISGGAVVAICAANASGSWTGATSLLAWASGTNVAVASFNNSGASVTGRTISYSGASASGMTAVAFVPTGTPAMAVFADNNGITGGAGTISTITLTTYGGIEYAGRVVVLPIFASGSSAITAVTIGGVTADISVTGSFVCLASAVVPTDANKAVVVTMATSDTPVALGTIIVYGATSATPVKSSTSSSNPFTIDVPGSGSLVTLAGFPSSSFTWSGVTALGVPIPAVVFWSPAHFDNAGGDITAYSVGSTPTPTVGYLSAVYLGTVIAPQDITSTGAVTVPDPTVVGAGALDSTASGAVAVPAPTAAGVATETPIWSFVGVSNAAINASGNYTLTEPAGTAQNDLLVVDFAVRSTVIYTNAAWVFPQSDAGGNTTNAATTSDTSFQTGYVIRGASAPTLVFSRASGSRALGSIRAYRSNSPGTPRFDTSGKFAQTTAATGITFTGGISTAEADELITTGVYLARGATTNNASAMVGATTVTGTSGALDTTTAPQRNTWRERVDRGDTTNPTVGLAAYDVVKSILGSTGNLSATAASSALNGITAMAFKHPLSLRAETGAIALAGIAATPRITMPAATGTFALTGVAATLTKATPVGLVQKNSGTVLQGAGFTPSFPAGTTAGNSIFLFITSSSTITTPSGFTSRSPNIVGQGQYLFEKLVASGNSSDTPAISFGGTFNGVWQIAEYSGVTAFDTSNKNAVNPATAGDIPTPTITPATGNKLLLALIEGNTSVTGLFNTGDPQSWGQGFTGQGSGTVNGTGSPGGNTRFTSGWGSRVVAASGGGYFATGNIGTTGTFLATQTIIAAYTTTMTPTTTSYTMPAATGTFTLAGVAATLTRTFAHTDYTMPAVVGAFALAGIAATLTKTTAGGGGGALIQKNGGTVSANASIVTSLGVATTAGNSIFIFASGGGTITTPSGFTSRSPQVNATGQYLFEKLVASGNSTDTPTLTMSGAFDAVWQIAEYSGITAYDTSTGTVVGVSAQAVYPTASITPASGNKRLLAFINAQNNSTGAAIVAGDPQGWGNGFTPQQANQIFGPGGAGRLPIASGWSDIVVAASGGSYSTSAYIGNGTNAFLPSNIIASYATTASPTVLTAPVFKSVSAQQYASRTNTVVPAPAGIVNGDILILSLALGVSGTPPTPTLPSGFTQIDTQRVGTGGFNVDQYIAWKRASSESGSYTITHSACSSNAVISVYSNCIATGSPIDVYSKNSGLTGTPAIALGVTTTVANTLALYIDHDWEARGARLPPSPFFERYDNLEYVADNVQPTAGATGNVSATNGNISSEPWQAWLVALKPVPAGATAYTLTAATGAFTLAGTTTGLKTARKLPAVPGAVTLAGIATGLKFGHKLPAVVGAFTLGGVAASTRAARMLPAVTGAFTLNGVAAALRYGRILTAVTGPFTLNGQIASLVYSSKKTLTAVTGTFALNGPATILKYARLFPTVTGTFALNGVANILRYGHRMVVTVGAFTLNGVAASLRTTRILPAVKGSVTLNGVAATLNYKRIMTVTTGSFVLNGSPANLINSSNPSKILPAVAGAFTLTGIAPVLRRKAILPAIKGSFTLAGTTTGLTAARRLVAVTGTFALSGKVTGLRVAHNLSTTTGVFTLNGNTASLRYGEGFHAITGAFTLTGYPAVLSRSLSIQPSLFTNTNVFYTPVVAIFQPLFPELFVNQNRFFTHSVSYKQFITPGLYSDPDRFFSPAVNLFYGDTEVVFAPYENRRMEATFERRSMIAPREDRLMYAMALEGTVDSPALAARENKFMEVLDEENDMFAGPRERA